MKKQTDITEKQQQGLDEGDEFNRKGDDGKLKFKNNNKLDLIYDSNHTFYKY